MSCRSDQDGNRYEASFALPVTTAITRRQNAARKKPVAQAGVSPVVLLASLLSLWFWFDLQREMPVLSRSYTQRAACFKTRKLLTSTKTERATLMWGLLKPRWNLFRFWPLAGEGCCPCVHKNLLWRGLAHCQGARPPSHEAKG